MQESASKAKKASRQVQDRRPEGVEEAREDAKRHAQQHPDCLKKRVVEYTKPIPKHTIKN